MKTELLFIAIGGCTIAAGAAVCLAKWRKRAKKALPEEEIPAAAEIAPETLTEFAARSRSFIGLYEPLWLAQNGQLECDTDLFAEWDSRISNMEDATALSRYWEVSFGGWENFAGGILSEKIGELFALTEKAGVLRSTEKEVVVSREIFARYFPPQGVRLEPGSTAVVAQPYWHIGGMVLEKGLLCRKEEGGESNGKFVGGSGESESLAGNGT